MEDSGIDSDCKTGFLRLNRPYVAIPDHDEDQDEDNNETSETTNTLKASSVVRLFIYFPLY